MHVAVRADSDSGISLNKNNTPTFPNQEIRLYFLQILSHVFLPKN